jgi:hypothetical protein
MLYGGGLPWSSATDIAGVWLAAILNDAEQS